MPAPGLDVTHLEKTTSTVRTGWPFYADDEIAAASRVLASGKVNYWTGNEGRQFEEEYAAHLGRQHAIAVANGTLALELALKVLGVGPGDEVVTTPRTFVASASCAISVGARPVFADIDRDSQNITAETIERVLTPKTKAIIAVHLAGWPCDMDPILELARSRGIFVIEDCAQAHGATYKGKPVGSFGDIAAFSFCQDKIITTAGEGGLVALDSTAQFEQGWAYKDHGKSFDAVYRRSHAPGFRWLHESFGTNWRLTEIQSAIGRIQLRKLPSWIAARRENANTLNRAFADLPGVRLTLPPADVGHAYYKYYFFLEPSELQDGWSRNRIMEDINARGVLCQVGSCSEIYLEKAFPESLRPTRRLPVAKELGETSLLLLVHPTLTAEQVEFASQTVRDVIMQAFNRN